MLIGNGKGAYILKKLLKEIDMDMFIS